jgi:hypothetical protein
MVNGVPSEPFDIQRGVRQGDPLSATIFVLVIEVLARNILNDPLLKGVAINSNQSFFINLLQYADDSSSLTSSYKELERILYHFDHFCTATSSKINHSKSAIIEVNSHLINDRPHPQALKIPIVQSAERYLGFYFNSDGLVRSLPNILKSIRNTLIPWKCSSSSIQTKMTIINTYILSKIIYHSYLETFTEEDTRAINDLLSWFMSAPSTADSTSAPGIVNSNNIKKTMPLMCFERSIKPMILGGWGMSNITHRQTAQKIWIYNRFLHLKNNNNSSTYMKSWNCQINNPTSDFFIHIQSKFLSFYYNYTSQHQRHPNLTKNDPILDNGKLISLKTIYNQLLDTDFKTKYGENNPFINKPKLTVYQEILKTRGYSFNKLYSNTLKLKNSKYRNTMFKFHSRCLPINHLHNTSCKLCNIDMKDDPYGHLFLRCKITRKFINLPELKQHIYKLTNNPSSPSFTLNNNKLIPIFNQYYKHDKYISCWYTPDHIINDKFRWSYRDINFDLDRTMLYRNFMSLIIHNVWIWICQTHFNQLLTDDEKTIIINQQLNYSKIEEDWSKLIDLEYSYLALKFNRNSIKSNYTTQERINRWYNISTYVDPL